MKVISSYMGLYLLFTITFCMLNGPQAPVYPKQPKGTNGPSETRLYIQ